MRPAVDILVSPKKYNVFFLVDAFGGGYLGLDQKIQCFFLGQHVNTMFECNTLEVSLLVAHFGRFHKFTTISNRFSMADDVLLFCEVGTQIGSGSDVYNEQVCNASGLNFNLLKTVQSYDILNA